MRVLVACCWPPDKGQGISAASKELAAGLSRAGHEVCYVTPPADGDAWYRDHGIRPLFVGPDLSPHDGLVEVVNILERTRPDLLINNDHPYVQAALPLAQCPTVVICHAMRWATGALARHRHEHVDWIVAISYDMWRSLIDQGVPIEKVVLVPNGIEDAAPDGDLGLESRGPDLRVVFAGNWSRVKGGDRLLAAIDAAPRNSEGIVFDCFGDGGMLRAARKRASPTLRVHGRVDRGTFLSALRQADVLVLPSRVEGCPMAVIEAMSFGVIPIVSDANGAMRWMVDSGIDGFVLPERDWRRGLWPVLVALAGDRARIRRMGASARVRYERQFAIGMIVERLVGLGQSRMGNVRETLLGVDTIRWHRPGAEKTHWDRLLSRVAYRAGIIRSSGRIAIPSKSPTKVSW